MRKITLSHLSPDLGPKQAVIYARVSSKEQEKEGFSIPAQLKLLKDYAAAQPESETATDRAIRGFVERYGPPEAAAAAKAGAAIRFLDYDWSLNDLQ